MCEVVADQATQLGVEIAWPRRDAGLVCSNQGMPLCLSVESVGRGANAVYAHHELALLPNQYREIADAVPENPYCLRCLAKKRLALPVAPLGQGLFQSYSDRLGQGADHAYGTSGCSVITALQGVKNTSCKLL